MKQIKFIGFMLCIMIVTLAFSCEDIKDTTKTSPCTESYQNIKSLKNVTGIIGFDMINDKYIINIHTEGTIDEMITAYPCELSDQLKKVGLKVELDGELFRGDDLPKPTLGGQEIFYIDIKEISVVN